ncbi:MAG: GDSL-type esterase/lipase family protein [Pirellulales bacterium]|nr:GDSL-type esterase/lipase family protein [Pirellulales bacterium]
MSAPVQLNSTRALCVAVVAVSCACTALAADGDSSTRDVVGDKNFQLRGSFDNSRIRFERAKKGHVAFIGGSITEMNGYRPLVSNWLAKRFPETEFTFTNAGISSTCSTTGAFRLKRDVLSKGPLDLLFVEFAVNDDQDAGHTLDDCVRGMEGIIAQARAHNPKVDIVITHFVNPGMLALLKDGKQPTSINGHNQVAKRHNVSVSHLAQELADQVTAGKTTWKMFGGTHPGKHGNAMAAAMITNALDKARSKPLPASQEAAPHKASALLDSSSYHRGRFLNFDKVKHDDHWSLSVPKLSPKDTGSLRGRFKGVPMLHSTTPGAKMTVTFKGTAIGAYILAGKDSAIVKYSIDGGPAKRLDTYHRYSGGLNYPRTVMFANDLADGDHTLTLGIEDRRTDAASKRGGTAFRVLRFVAN